MYALRIPLEVLSGNKDNKRLDNCFFSSDDVPFLGIPANYQGRRE
jgi:hypothetical protein